MLSRRTPPVNFKPTDQKFFEHELVKEIPNHELTVYRDKAIITPDGVVIKHGRIETASLYSDQHNAFLNGAYRVFYNCAGFFTQPTNGRHLLAFDAWSAGYFHWMTEFIPRLFKSKHVILESTVILPSVNNSIWNKASAFRSLYRKGQTLPQNGYSTESLEAFNLRSTYKHTARIPLVTKDLYFSSHLAPSGNYNDQVMRELREFYFGFYEIPKEDPHRLVYVSRNLATRRHIQNENEVIENLHLLGFEIFSLETLSFREQVILLSQTKFLIGQHGAGLTNLLFMKNSTFVLELKTEGDSQNLCYFSLASAMNVNYLFQFCAGDGRTVQDSDITVDIDLLNQNLKMVLS